MAPYPANFLNQLPQKESGEKLYASRSRQLSASAPSKRIRLKIIWLQIPPTLFISSLKKNLAKNFFISSLKQNLAKNYMAPDPANSLISSLTKNLAENYMAPDPASFVHQLSHKESCGKLYGSRSRQLCSSVPSKRVQWKIMAPDTANFVHQLPQKESGEKLDGSRSRQLSSSAPSKRFRQKKNIWLQIPPTLFISTLKKNPAKNYMAPDPANFLQQLPQ